MTDVLQDWASNTVIEEILQGFPEQIVERRRKLADTAWRSRNPHAAREYHNPYRVQQLVRTWEDRANPFSRDNLVRQAIEAESRMINTSPTYIYVMRDPDTGEVVDEERFENNVDITDPAVRAYVADLN